MKENIKNFDNPLGFKSPLIIAELGTSHNGNLIKAKKLIDAAADCGADCIKVQIVYADEILHPNTGEVPLPGGRIRLYDQFKALETPPEFYMEIKNYTESKGLLFLCTPFGLKSASILHKMQPKLVKIASPELNFTSLLKEVAGWNIPILLSTGVSRLSDIENAILVTSDECLVTSDECLVTSDECGVTSDSKSSLHTTHYTLDTKKTLHTTHYTLDTKICLLHCVTSYPAPEVDYNLRVLPNLSAIFGVSVGVSDHSADPVLVPALAVSMGAVVIEKHFCLSRDDPGLDDPIALPPEDFSRMVKAVNFALEIGPEETIAFYSRERGAEFVEQILGNGIKELAPSEKANYRLTNRSIHALRDINKGEVLKKEDYAVLRTEKVLRPGLEPYWESSIEGRTARNFIPSGEGIRFDDI